MLKLTALKKKNIFFLIPLVICLGGAFVYYFTYVKLRPNDLIITTSDGTALFSNENPTFKVDFGSKENPHGQMIRFEAEASKTNPFEVGVKKSIFTKIAELFQTRKKHGIEMSLVGIDFSETEKNIDPVLTADMTTVAGILGTDQVTTTTNLVDMGREIGEYETEIPIAKQTIVNGNVANGIDLEYQILSGLGLKEEIVINDLEEYADSCGKNCSLPLNKFEFDLSVDDGVVLKKGWFTVKDQSTEIYYFVDGDGNYLAHFLPSYAVDASGNKTYGVDLNIEEYSSGKFKAIVTVDPSWLLSENRVYPIRIDPSIVHDETSDFSGGTFNRVESVTGPKIQALANSVDTICTGGTITKSGGYVIHTFSSTGASILECNRTISADLLIIGGGGGGGGSNGAGGGGGAGGVVYKTNFAVTTGSYTVTVGGGGNGSTAAGSSGANGSSSSLGSLISASGGGGGGGYDGTNTTAPGTGGSGGGGGSSATGSFTGGSGTSGQGFSGGNGLSTSTVGSQAGGGGGGASEAGTASTASLSGDGGDGISNSITGVAVVYGGGGAGAKRSTGSAGSPGTGGGGTAGVGVAGGNGTDGLGGGGGGGGNGNSGGNGGSGIVVVRYKTPSFNLGTYISSVIDLGSTMTGGTLSWTASGIETGNGETPYSTTGLVAQWNFNETSGTTAVSGGTCGTSCNGTLTNMTTSGQDAAIMTGWTANYRRWGAGALMFDGTNDYVINSSPSGLPSGNVAKTLEVWFRFGNSCATYYCNLGGFGSNALEGNNFQVGSGYNGDFTVWGWGVTYDWDTGYSVNNVLDGFFHLVTVTYDGTTTSLYVDAVLRAQTASYAWNTSTTKIMIGEEIDGSGQAMSGIIDSFRIYSRALSDTEILSNYQSADIEFQYRVSADNSTWSDWISDGVSTSDYSWRTFDDQYLYDSSSSGLVTYWTMDESTGSVVYDVSGINHSSASGTTIVSGKYGNARSFNGSSDYLLASPSLDIPLKTGSFTLSGWFNASNLTSSMTLLQRGLINTGGLYYGMGLYVTSSEVFFVRNVGGASQVKISYTYSASTNTWYHIAATYNDSTGAAAIYLNGVLMVSGTLSTNDVSYNASYDQGYTIGATLRNTSNSYSSGIIDELQIFNTVLSSSDINNQYLVGLNSLGVYQQKGVGAYQLGVSDTYLYSSSESGQTSYWPMENPSGSTVSDVTGSNSGTASGTTVVSGKYGNARSFNGTSDYVSVPNTIDTPLKTGSFTLSGWFNASSFTNYMTLLQRGLVNTSGIYYGMGLYATSSELRFIRNVGGASQAQVLYTYNFLTNVWYHIAATYNDSTGAVALYLNGILVSSGTLSTNDVSYHASYDQGYTVGATLRNTSNSYSSGIIDELRVFNTVRSASDIEDEYERGRDATHLEGGVRTEGLSSSRLTNSLGNGLVSYWTLNESSGTSLADSIASNTGTATGTSVVVGKYSNARSFNGTSDYINIGKPSNIGSLTSNISVEAWIRLNDVSSSHDIIASARTNSANGFSFSVNGTALRFSTSGVKDYNSTTITLTTGTWYHVAAVMDSGYDVSFYVNGVFKEIVTHTAPGKANSDDDIYIGSGTVSGSTTLSGQFSGYLDEVKVYNIAKTSDEMLEEYNATSTYYANYLLNSLDLSDDSTISVDIAGDKVGSYASLVWGESAYVNNQTDANTVGLWHLDEISGSGAYIKDSSGSNNHATPTGTTYIGSGRLAGGRSFNGSSDYITIGSNINLSPTTQVTVAAWIKSDSTISADEAIYDRLNSAQGYGIYIDANGKAVFSINGGAATAISNMNVDDKLWHYIVGRYDNGESGTQQIRIYVDGMLSGTGNYTTAINYSTEPRNQIGRMNTGSYFGGYIDEISISNTIRTVDQIRQAYEIGLRTYNVTVDFGAILNSGNLISNSSDTSFTIDATAQGLSEMGSNLYSGDKIIVREISGGTEYIAQGTVSSITATTGVTTVSSWDSSSTFPSGGFTTKASIFKWQTEYIPIKNRTISTQVDASSLLTLKLTNAFGGRNIWIDNLRTSDGHLINSLGEILTFPYNAQYFQYKAIITSYDSAVTPYISQVQFDYSTGGPALDQIMRHGKWFDSGVKKSFWWTGSQQ